MPLSNSSSHFQGPLARERTAQRERLIDTHCACRLLQSFLLSSRRVHCIFSHASNQGDYSAGETDKRLALLLGGRRTKRLHQEQLPLTAVGLSAVQQAYSGQCSDCLSLVRVGFIEQCHLSAERVKWPHLGLGLRLSLG